MADGDIVPAGKTSFVRVENMNLLQQVRSWQLCRSGITGACKRLLSDDEKKEMDCAKTIVALNIDVSKDYQMKMLSID